MINFILKHKIFKKNPPVLFDLGAGGDAKTDWNDFYKLSHIYKLDANDNIEKNYNENKQTIINEIIFNKHTKLNFNLTKSIFCSSLLSPNYKELQNWTFKSKFDLKKKIKIKTKTFSQIVSEKRIKNIDWIKFDLQGIDLKIFKSIPPSIQKKILIVEFEPGLYNFYKNEDKLSEILQYMEKDYSIEDFVFSSSLKGNYKFFKTFNFLQKKSFNLINKKSKFYTNISFIKKNNLINKKDLRSILLILAILVLKKRYIEALELISKNKRIDPILNDIEKKIFFKIKFGIILYFVSRPYYLIKRILKLIK
tara:strand:+ start:1912 stop:2835 length:924 start_codon:yes stop_codon:yes gene_type:complete